VSSSRRLLLFFACAALGCAAARKPTAAELIEQNAEAHGGLEAFRKVRTMTWIGHIESDHAPAPSMPFKLEQKRPNKMRLEIDVMHKRSMRAFNGTVGWKLAPGGPPVPQPYSDAELRSAREVRIIDGPLLDHATKGITASYEGVDDLKGQRAWHLQLRLPGGATEDVWLDTDTALELRYDRSAQGPDGQQRRISTWYSDYRAVEGIKLPFVIQTGGDPKMGPDRMVLERVILNAPIEDREFEDPNPPRGRSMQLALPGDGSARPGPPQAEEAPERR
jgi:hypothetical protein